MKFSIKDILSKCDQTEEVLNGKLHLLCSDIFLTLAGSFKTFVPRFWVLKTSFTRNIFS